MVRESRTMPTPEERFRCLVTGSTGYLGGQVKAALTQRGWTVGELTRQAMPVGCAIEFQLGADVAPSTLGTARALVHCAYDFSQLSWREIHRVNVRGSEKLLTAAVEAGIDRVVYISSISAFERCRSLYGKAKLEIETIALSLGATVIRPGLVWGFPGGAVFGRLRQLVEGARVLPVFRGGSQSQHLVHEEDLTHVICRFAEGTLDAPRRPITVAHEHGWTLREILAEIARAQNKKVSFVPVPWKVAWGLIKAAELSGLRLTFRSDSLISLMHQNPEPSFGPLRELNIVCRPFGTARGTPSSA